MTQQQLADSFIIAALAELSRVLLILLSFRSGISCHPYVTLVLSQRQRYWWNRTLGEGRQTVQKGNGTKPKSKQTCGKAKNMVNVTYENRCGQRETKEQIKIKQKQRKKKRYNRNGMIVMFSGK